MPPDLLLNIVIYGIPLLLAIPLHEAAHGWVAHRCGDPTAYLQGRVTFNPLKHIDPIGTVALPVMLILSGVPFVFGWAKPVPVNFRLLRRPRRDMMLVAVAGPALNLILAFLSALGMRFVAGYMAPGAENMPWWGEMLVFSLLLNTALAIFNLLPILPMDGGRILHGALPDSLARPYARTERWGMPFIFALFLLPPVIGMVFSQQWSVFNWILAPAVYAIADSLLFLVGL